MMNDQRTWRLLPVLALGLWLIASPYSAQAQTTVVVPNANASVAGNSDNRFPLLVNGGMRYQQVFDATEFSSLGGPQFIDQISFRNGPFVATSFSATIASIQISLSTVSTAADALSSTFASNIGGDNTQVYGGSLTISSTNGAGPGNTHVFDITVNFQIPFLYDPSAGNLLLDIQSNSGADSNINTDFFDAQNTIGDSVSRVYGAEGSPGATSGTADSNGLIAQFGIVAVPEPATIAMLGLGVTGTVGVMYRRNRKNSIALEGKLRK